ncbi:hypothetical protein Tco_0872982 [Tanacetum coccineum]
MIKKRGFDSLNTQSTEDDLVSTEKILREYLINSKGCKDWEHICMFSLLSVLTTIVNRVDLFSIPTVKLVSSMKLTLVLSSEVPELFQKVDRNTAKVNSSNEEKKMEVVALMVIAQFKSKRQPLVDLFSVGSALESDEPWEGPWGTNTIVDTIAPGFKIIIKDYHILPSIWKAGLDVTNMLC